jgi:glycerate dehydrogenase
VKPRIVVLDGFTVNPGDNPWDELAALGELVVHERTPPERILERAADAEIVLTNKTPLRAETLERLPQLRFVAVLATGTDCVDLAAARRRGIPVSNVPEYGSDAVAQHVFALLLALVQKIPEHHAAVRRGEWSRSPDFSFWIAPPVELAGKRLGIVGLGRIGRRVAEIGRAFGMEPVASLRPGETSARADESGIPRLPLDEVFATSGVVSLHCPLTAETRGLVGRERLERTKPGTYLVNTARGGLLDEAAVADALRSGLLAGAGLDVAAHEPLDPASPLLGAPNLILTPHMAWASLAARRRLLATTVENVRAFLAGKPLRTVA